PREIEAVVRRKEEVSRPEHARDRRDQRRDQAEVPAREQHREEIDDRAAAYLQRLGQRVDHDRGHSHYYQGDGAAAQFASNRIHSNQGPSSCAGGGAVGWPEDNTPAPVGHPSPPLLVKGPASAEWAVRQPSRSYTRRLRAVALSIGARAICFKPDALTDDGRQVPNVDLPSSDREVV